MQQSERKKAIGNELESESETNKKSAMLVAAAFVFLSALSFHFGAVDVVAVRFDCLCV